MRINKKLYLLERVTRNNRLFIEHVADRGGKVKVVNYEELIQALDYLANEPWNNINSGRIRDIIKSYGLEGEQILGVNEYDWLQTYVRELNEEYPLYFSIIATQVSTEDEKSLNILIPTSINTFDDLLVFDKSLSKIFKSLKISGEINFVSFDKGTNWYVLAANSVTAYYLIMTCLGTAQEIVNLKKIYHEGAIASLQHKALKKADSNFALTEEEFEKITLDSVIAESIGKKFTPKVLKELSRYGTKAELLSGINISIAELISLLESGSTIEPSNNHPEFLTTKNGDININIKAYLEYESEKTIGETPLLEEGETGEGTE